MHEYKTISAPGEGIYKEKGSRFLGYAFPVENEADVKKFVEELKKEQFKARHHCYAYRIGLDGSRFRANDDGEPSGSAGKPILGRIDSLELTNVLVVVVRYFGGVKLGVSGMIRSYRQAASLALENAPLITREVQLLYRLQFPYLYMNELMQLVKRLELDVKGQDYAGNNCVLQLQVSAANQAEFEDAMTELRSIEYELVES